MTIRYLHTMVRVKDLDASHGTYAVRSIARWSEPLFPRPDGMPDEWENKYDFDPSFAGDNSQDADGDRYTNIEEFLNGTDPREFHG